jgi:hypothetical protein
VLPERPELHSDVEPDGAVSSSRAQRWRDGTSDYAPFGARRARRTFDCVTLEPDHGRHGTAGPGAVRQGEVVAVERRLTAPHGEP